MEFVLIPGAWMSAWVWEPVTHGLRALGHRVYPITLSGPADGDAGVSEVGLRTHVDGVLSVLEAEDLRNAVAVGHSYSGIVAGQVAPRARTRGPRRVRRRLPAARRHVDARRVRRTPARGRASADRGFFGLFWGCFAVLLADLSRSLGLSPGPLGVALFVGVYLYKDPALKGKRNGKADYVRVKGRIIENIWGEEGCTFRNAVEIASMYNFINRMSLACGMIPNEEYHALAR